MRTASVTVILLCLASSLSGSAAEPPAVAKPAPAPATPPNTAAVTAPSTAPAAAHPPATASEPVSVPDRIEPTEKVHADSEISFPVDI